MHKNDLISPLNCVGADVNVCSEQTLLKASQMAKVLLVEDDHDISELVADYLSYEHYQVDRVYNGADGLDRLKFYQYDVVILDWELPQMTGLEICKQYREAGGLTPILMLTAKRAIDDRAEGLDVGADDYLVKPFHVKELLSRIRALLRRASQKTSNLLRVGDLEMNPTTYEVKKAGVGIDLMPKDFALLEFLMRHPNEIFSGEALLNHVWKAESDSTAEALRASIKRIRKKIDSSEGDSLIKNLHGVGYKLVTETTSP